MSDDKVVAKKPDLPSIDRQTVKIRSYSPTEIDVFKELTMFDNLYRGLCKDEEQHRIHIIQLKKALQEVRSKQSLRRQIAQGLFQDVTPQVRGDIIRSMSITLNNLYDSYAGLIEQRKHRGDELGDTRIRVLKVIAKSLMNQHNLTVDDLTELLKDESTFKPYRDKDDINVDIKKALELTKNG